MSNDAMKKFKGLYSDYLGLVAELHNYQLVYTNRIGKRTAVDFRRCIINLVKVQRELQRATVLVYRENIQNIKDNVIREKKDARIKRKELDAWKRANPKKRGPKPKENNNDNN